MKDQNTPTNTLDLADAKITDSAINRFDQELIDRFDQEFIDKYFTDKAKAELEQYVSEAVNKAEIAMWEETTKAVMDILQENFHYRLMCGEVKDPDGKIDVMSEFVKYQELEPERKKFSEYIEKLKSELKPPNQVEGEK